MKTLLTRDEFREGVFRRDNNTCVVCENPAEDAHHLLDRKLFDDGGYYIDNGVSLCGLCHKRAEKSELTVEQLRELAKITNIILPSHLKEGIIYDKWGEPVDFNKKYPRSLHAHISLGTESDDRFMPSGYVTKFAKRHLILTEKLDGQNCCMNEYGLYARSHAAPSSNSWDKPMIPIWESIKNDLKGGLELFGESMYAVHSIEYRKLESHFYMFGVRMNGVWESWDDVKYWAELFGFPTVPEIKIKYPLSMYFPIIEKDENKALRLWLKDNLGMDWEEYVETGGALDGFDPITGASCCEGFVVRHENAYKVNQGILPVMHNEFDSLFKLVRKKHVKTDTHWTKNWKRAKLIYEQF